MSSIKASTAAVVHSTTTKVKSISDSDSIKNVKRRASVSWENTCTKSTELAKKTKEEVIVPTWQKTCVATTAAVATAKPILTKTVETTKATAHKASEKSSKVYKKDIKPAANKAGKAISKSVKRASDTAATMFD